jgi:hypothetical protein
MWYSSKIDKLKWYIWDILKFFTYKRRRPFRVFNKKFIRVSHVADAFYMHRPPHPYWLRSLYLPTYEIILSVCPSVSFLVSFEPSNRFLWHSVLRSCHWSWPRCSAFQSRGFNHFHMTDVQTFDVDVKLAAVNVGSWNVVCWYIFKGRQTFNKTIFVINQKYERGGRLNVVIYILFYGDNS